MAQAENNMDKSENKIREVALQVIKEYMKSSAFTDRKLTDTPTDSLQVVNRKYVTNNGTSANRPKSSVIGQPYFDTQISRPIWWNGTNFQDAAGNVV